MRQETMMSAPCALCEETVERDEAAVVGSKLVCVRCCARVGLQSIPVLKRSLKRRRKVAPALALAAAFAEAGR